MFNKIDIDVIVKFINDIDVLSNIRKEFYVNIIKERYNILKEIYEKQN